VRRSGPPSDAGSARCRGPGRQERHGCLPGAT
jgi:hypothetical protein